MSGKILTAYFSASGVTAKAAEKLSKAAGGDLYEIKPEVPYTSADLNWMDENSRSTLEMKNPASRPAIAGPLPDMGNYQVIFVGFPIWWYAAPTIINTFLESLELSGKTVIPFATSGGSGMGKTVEKLKISCPKATVLPGKMLNGRLSEADLKAWVQSLNL